MARMADREVGGARSSHQVFCLESVFRESYPSIGVLAGDLKPFEMGRGLTWCVAYKGTDWKAKWKVTSRVHKL